MKNLKILIVIVILPFYGCMPENPDYQFIYDTIIGESPVNLQQLNSVYDDYNSNLSYPAAGVEINFSTNRNSLGEDFDIICKTFEISYHINDDILNLGFSYPDNYSIFQTKLLPLINTQYNELGPFARGGASGYDYFFYANNESGDYDINFVYTPRADWAIADGLQRLYGPFKVTLTDSESDDLYPTINQDMTEMLFCSDREDGKFDIYNVSIVTENLFHDLLLSETPVPVIKETVLSSSSNDKCPSINRNLLVFTSDRDGGYGGFDLYYSLYDVDHWTEPVNFGEKINSSADEYRPITFSFNDIGLMIFSSNRDGGKGGFDLYCVRIEDLIQ